MQNTVQADLAVGQLPQPDERSEPTLQGAPLPQFVTNDIHFGFQDMNTNSKNVRLLQVSFPQPPPAHHPAPDTSIISSNAPPPTLGGPPPHFQYGTKYRFPPKAADAHVMAQPLPTLAPTTIPPRVSSNQDRMFPISRLPIPYLSRDLQNNEPSGPFITSMQHSRQTSSASVVSFQPRPVLHSSQYHQEETPKQSKSTK